ncbi:MAG: hypothetical protein ABSG95_02250 [Solirubrobacteraceae bacterium]|jgi:hypothetical protein
MRAGKTIDHAAKRTTRLALLAAVLSAGLLANATAASAQACPNEARRTEQGSGYLPECRAYELVSPVLKNEEEVASEVNAAQGQSLLPFQASTEGARAAYSTVGGLPNSRSGGHFGQYLAESATLGSTWKTLPLNPESRFSNIYFGDDGPTGSFEHFSPNLSCGVEQTELPQPKQSGEETPQLAPGETPQERIENLYMWEAATGSYTLVSNVRPDNVAEVTPADAYLVDGASADCRHILFQSEYRFLGAPEGSLYEWSEGELHVASLLGHDEPAEGVLAVDAGETRSNLNAMSSDGKKAFFTAKAEKGSIDEGAEKEVFVRLNGASTVEASASKTAHKDTGALFQAASADGSQVFFTANYGLTEASSKGTAEKCESSGAEPGIGCDLYDYDVNTGGLTDISADTRDEQGANVRGVVGISQDGSVVYFSTSGQLLEGQGNTEAENEATTGTTRSGAPKTSTEANVYAYHEGTLSYVASIAQSEAGGLSKESAEQVDAISSSAEHGMDYEIARVSSEGNYLLFATRKQVTSYDNEDEATKTRALESYEYSLSSGTVSCVSCNREAGRPTSTLKEEGEAAFSPLASYVFTIDGYLPHGLSDTGRVFFDRSEPLLKEATNNTVNVYEWQPPGIAGCEAATGCVQLLDSGKDSAATYFADATPDGENVYLTTDARAAPEDQDGLRDLYDVRVNGGIPASFPAACSGEGCQPSGPGVGSSTRASESGLGAGNLPNPAPPPPGTGVGVGEVKSFMKHLVKGSSVTLTVSAPAKGRITVSGRGLGTVKATASKAGTYRLKVSLTAAEKRILKRRHRVKLTLRISFLPASGKASATSTTVTFT